MSCPNVRELFPKCRTAYDPACEHKSDAWCFVIPCRYGCIYPFGRDLLAVDCDGHPQYANRLAALGLRLHQDGDDEKTFVFAPSRFPEVAAIVRPKMKPTYSEADLQARRERMNAKWKNDGDFAKFRSKERTGSLE